MKTFKSIEDFAAEVKTVRAKAADINAAWNERNNQTQLQQQKMEAKRQADEENAAKLRASQMKYGFYLIG